MRIPISVTSSPGLIQDVNPWELPLTAWTDGRNVRFTDSGVEKFLGHELAFTPEVSPLWAMPVFTTGAAYWLYASDAQVFCWTPGPSGGTHTEITRLSGPYGAGPTSWTGGMLNNLAVLNSGGDAPQLWSPLDPATSLVDLPNWPSGWIAKVVRPFREYLVALDVTKGSTAYPNLVAWSHSAEPGAIPDSWDSSDTTRDAGETTLAASNGPVIDCLPLRGQNIIYQSDSVTSMQYTGGVFVFRFERVLQQQGILARHCVQPINLRGAKHVVLGFDDLYIHDGVYSESVLGKQMRRTLVRSIDTTFYQRSFLATNPKREELWVCFPEPGAEVATLALVWNWRDNTSTFRELPSVGFIGTGLVEVDRVLTWDDDSSSWDSSQTMWDEPYFTPVSQDLLMLVPGDTPKAYLADRTNTFDGAAFTSFVERQGISVVGKDYATGRPIHDTEVQKLCTEVWPRIIAPTGSVMKVFIGVQQDRNDAIAWSALSTFTVGVDKKLNCLASGKIFSIRVEATGSFPWQLAGYDLEIKKLGGY